MRLKITTRHGIFHADGYGPDGKRVRRSLKTTDPRRAEELRTDLEKRLWQLHLYGASAVMTFDQAAVAYAEDGGETRFLVKISEQLSGTPLHSITPKIIRNAAEAAYPNAKPATRNREGVTPAQAVVNYAHDQGWCGPIKVKRFPVEKPKREAVGIEYLAALEPHAPTNLFALILFVHTTGRRVGDAIGLTPDDIDLENGTAFIAKTKNGDSATVNLVPVLVDILRELPTSNGHVFGYKDRRNLYATLKRSCDRAGIKYLGTHQVGRHSFATALEREGWNSKAIADAGGWKSVRLVDETYIHTNDPAARATALLGRNWSRVSKASK